MGKRAEWTQIQNKIMRKNKQWAKRAEWAERAEWTQIQKKS